MCVLNQPLVTDPILMKGTPFLYHIKAKNALFAVTTCFSKFTINFSSYFVIWSVWKLKYNLLLLLRASSLIWKVQCPGAKIAATSVLLKEYWQKWPNDWWTYNYGESALWKLRVGFVLYVTGLHIKISCAIIRCWQTFGLCSYPIVLIVK